MTSLNQVNQLIKTLEHIQDLDQKKGLTEEYHRGWQEGFRKAARIFCTHPSNCIEADFSESEQFAFCTLYEKDMTEDYTNELEGRL